MLEDELRSIQNTLRVDKVMSDEDRENLVERRKSILDLLNRDKLLYDVYME